jgi:hypothetical protein
MRYALILLALHASPVWSAERPVVVVNNTRPTLKDALGAGCPCGTPCPCVGGLCPSMCAKVNPAAKAPAPVGNPPGPNFKWKSLPGVGWGWVQDGAESLPRGPVAPPVGCGPGGCTPKGGGVVLPANPFLMPCPGGVCPPRR